MSLNSNSRYLKRINVKLLSDELIWVWIMLILFIISSIITYKHLMLTKQYLTRPVFIFRLDWISLPITVVFLKTFHISRWNIKSWCLCIISQIDVPKRKQPCEFRNVVSGKWKVYTFKAKLHSVWARPLELPTWIFQDLLNIFKINQTVSNLNSFLRWVIAFPKKFLFRLLNSWNH